MIHKPGENCQPDPQPPIHPGTTLWTKAASAARPGRSHDLLGRCPFCNGALILAHRHPGPADHLLRCNTPHCSYQRNYDAALHRMLESISATLARLEARLIRIEAHESWLLVQVEALYGQWREEGV